MYHAENFQLHFTFKMTNLPYSCLAENQDEYQQCLLKRVRGCLYYRPQRQGSREWVFSSLSPLCVYINMYTQKLWPVNGNVTAYTLLYLFNCLVVKQNTYTLGKGPLLLFL